MRKIAALVLAGSLVAAFASTADASKPKTVWEDPEGDADTAGQTPPLDAAGFDLVKGEIARNKKDLEFTVTHASAPPFNQPGEAFRFLWAFMVGPTEYRITAKSADIGDPDWLNQETTERLGQVDLNGHFRLEGDCKSEPTAALNAINCEPLEYVDGTFDPETASFTVVIPMELMKEAKPGTKIIGSGGNGAAICQICWVTHVVERSPQTTVIDNATQTTTYKIPKK